MKDSLSYGSFEYLLSLTEWRERPGFSLDNIAAVMKELGDPQDCVKTVIVGGTNGKGSVSTAIASILGVGGHKVGLNTSPHLSRFSERIVIDGVPVADKLVATCIDDVRMACERCSIDLSFHEAVTAVAFCVFATERVDFSILEVGVGGRLDAANVVRSPAASVIVTVDLDHQHILGNTVAEISLEKSGIIRNGGMVVTGDLLTDAHKVISSRASELAARHLALGRDYSCEIDIPNQYFYINSREQQKIPYVPSLSGAHQAKNMAVAMTVGRELGISASCCAEGVAGVYWPARLEWVKWKERDILFDCAHNPAGVGALVAYLKSQSLENLAVVFGALESKNWRGMVDQLIHYCSDWYLLEPKGTNALSCDVLEAYLLSSGSANRSKSFGTNYEALMGFLEDGNGSSDLPLLVTGSIYMIGGVRDFFYTEQRPLWWRAKPNSTMNLNVSI